MRRLALIVALLAGCGSTPAPAPLAPAAPAAPPVVAASPSDPLAQAREHFQARRYAEAAELARFLDGQEAEELTAMAYLACGRELQAMTAYDQLARRYPKNPGYAQIYRGLHNGFVLKRTDHYLNRAAGAFNAGRKAECARLVEAALDALYSQQGTEPDPRRLKAARQLRAALYPPAPPRPAPPPVRLQVAPPAAPRSPSYPQARPRPAASVARVRSGRIYVRRSTGGPAVAGGGASLPGADGSVADASWGRPVEAYVVAPRPRPPVAQPYQSRRATSRVASLRAGESLLHVRGASMQPYSGGSGSYTGW